MIHSDIVDYGMVYRNMGLLMGDHGTASSCNTRLNSGSSDSSEIPDHDSRVLSPSGCDSARVSGRRLHFGCTC